MNLIFKSNCGFFIEKAISTVNITIYCVCLSMADSRPSPTTCFLAIMWIVANSRWKPSACCWPTRSSFPKTFSCYAATTSVQASIAFTASTTNVTFLSTATFFRIGFLLFTNFYFYFDQNEGKRRYNIKLWKTFTDCFNCLPVAAIIDEKIFCCHGGLSPDLQSMEQIRRIMRPTDVPDQGLLCDLLWSDPDKDITGWGENDRGVSFTFGGEVVSKFLHKHDLDLICRAHQVVEDGYEFFAKRQLVTLFSAPNYCGEFDNAGAMMSVDETLMCSFQVSFSLLLIFIIYPRIFH